MNNFDEITKDFVKWLDTLDEDSIIRIQQKDIERLQHNQEVSTKWEIKLTQKNTKLKEENKRLKSIIKEAIEYLESYNTDFKNCRFGEAPISIRELGDLLDILKGSDKE